MLYFLYQNFQFRQYQRMMMNNKYENIYKDDTTIVKGAILEDSLRLIMQVKQSIFKTQIFEANLQSLKEFGPMEKLCDNFKDIIQMLKTVKELKNFDIKIERGKLKIFQKHPMKKEKIVNEVSIQFKLIEVKQKQNSEEILQKIYQKCDRVDELKNQEIKQLFYLVGTTLEKLLKTHKNEKNTKQQEQCQIQMMKLLKAQSFEQQMNKCQNDTTDDLKIGELRKQIITMRDDIRKQQDQDRKLIVFEIIRQINDHIRKIRNQFEDKINQLKNFSSYEFISLKQTDSGLPMNPNKIEVRQQQNEEKISSIRELNWVDSSKRNHNNNDLIRKNNIITAISDMNILGSKKLTGKCSFTVKFTKINNKNNKNTVKLGIANKKTFFSTDRSTMMGGNDSIYRQNSQSTFKQGEIITVALNMDEGIIQYKVGEAIWHEEKVERLRVQANQQFVTWVPYIYLHKDAEVQIIQ